MREQVYWDFNQWSEQFLSTCHRPFILVVAYQYLDYGYIRMLVLQMEEQVSCVFGDKSCTHHPCTLITIGSIQCIGTWNTNNNQLLPDLFEWSGKLSIKSKH